LEVKTQHGSNGNGSGQELGNNSGSKNVNGNRHGCSTSRNAVAGALKHQTYVSVVVVVAAAGRLFS
jgi:hypothetical protein